METEAAEAPADLEHAGINTHGDGPQEALMLRLARDVGGCSALLAAPASVVQRVVRLYQAQAALEDWRVER